MGLVQRRQRERRRRRQEVDEGAAVAAGGLRSHHLLAQRGSFRQLGEDLVILFKFIIIYKKDVKKIY